MSVTYCGLDVGSSTCHVAGKTKDGDLVADQKFDTQADRIRQVFEKIPGEVHVHMEASELAGWVRQILRSCPRVQRILVSNPKENSWIAKDANKNDRRDARKLADLLRSGLADDHEVYYPDDPDRAVFKQIVQHYEKLTRQESQLKMQIKSRLRQHGVIARGGTVYTPKGRVAFVEQVPSPPAREMLAQLFTLLDRTLEGQKAAHALMRKTSKRYAEIARFDEVPGVGLITACRFCAYVQTPDRFGSKRKLWRYCRLGIAKRSSDDSPVSREALDWNGIGSLKDVSRKAFEGAMRTRKDNLFKRAYRASVQRTGNQTHARLSTQRKIVAVLRALWKEGTRYQDDKG